MWNRGWFGWGGLGMGRGNPYPFCRFAPWLPRRWWAYGAGAYPMAAPMPYGTGPYAPGLPYNPTYGQYPGW